MTNEISLREVQESDLPLFFGHQLDEEATRMAAFPSRDHEAFMAHWQKIRADAEKIVRTIVCGGEVAGNIGCWQQDEKHLVGYWLGKAYWGRGIATLALTQFIGLVKTRPLYAYVAKTNVGSIRVLQKCGFTTIGEDTFPLASGEIGEEFIMKL
jgi:RimJ/RimL family protein N-acetyltransferase